MPRERIIQDERFALAIEASCDGIWDWRDTTKGETFWWSARFEETLGYRRGELAKSLSTFYDVLLHPQDRERIRDAFNAHVKENSPFDVEYRLRNSSGEYKWFRARGQAIRDDDGRPSSMAGSIMEISSQKRAEQELIQYNERLQSARQHLEQQAVELERKSHDLEVARRTASESSRAKSEFLANMSHEIRTPMTAILGFADLLLNEEGIERAPPSRFQAIETIKRNGEYLLGLINDILDLSKVEAGKLEVEQITCAPA